MLTIYTDKHRLRDSQTELYGGQLVYPHERPSRANLIIEKVRNAGLGEVREPDSFGMETAQKVHDPAYLTFLETAWTEWKDAGFEGEAIATCWPARRATNRAPSFIDGKLGYYSHSAETAISDGTWEASVAAKDVVLTGAQALLQGEKAVFSLCRPPGHHAAYDLYGGYCFLNNVAIAAQYLRDQGSRKVAILDVDYHHGNGTQDIFYGRDDVYFLSLHGAPEEEYPYFWGYADETGEGQGDGYTVNYPLPKGTSFATWRGCLEDALQKIADYAPDHLLVSLGVDTFENDPISSFKLASDDFTTYGKLIGQANLPTLFVMEGGYDIDEVGLNTLNVLQGFEQA